MWKRAAAAHSRQQIKRPAFLPPPPRMGAGCDGMPAFLSDMAETGKIIVRKGKALRRTVFQMDQSGSQQTNCDTMSTDATTAAQHSR